MATHERKTIDLEQGWEFMQKGITKLKNILEGKPEPQFSSEDYMMLYTSDPLIRFCATGRSTTCARRSRRTITRSSSTRSTASPSRSTSPPW
ncbi:hypothetical protein PR202_gb20342 [Eleusine coracana subsp. coracana]|uniref:Uncharacterized protein n=1 Tax=Eleusine coracana subsp. coracana TaxID=191504 RepID=A0AAV5FAE4_ELECO|nr:hypothetical protein PR202_gb20342 [Eleusine coracana subsp. coracana]